MTWREWSIVVTFVLGLCAGLLAGYFIRTGKTDRSEVETRTEIRIERKTDTIRVDVPRIHKVRVVDTMLVAVTDTIIKHDTTFVQLPRQEKVYRDSSYMAIVSGYLPSLDQIEVYNKTQTITKIVFVPERKRWGFGLGPTVGLGWVSSFGGDAGTGIFTGIGFSFSYNF